jgi:hypothetical protein
MALMVGYSGDQFVQTQDLLGVYGGFHEPMVGPIHPPAPGCSGKLPPCSLINKQADHSVCSQEARR